VGRYSRDDPHASLEVVEKGEERKRGRKKKGEKEKREKEKDGERKRESGPAGEPETCRSWN
jgi:hypothetical protein